MDTQDKIALFVFAVIATFFVSFEFISWEFKNHIVTGVGVMMFLLIVWAIGSDVSRRYKVVKVD